MVNVQLTGETSFGVIRIAFGFFGGSTLLRTVFHFLEKNEWKNPTKNNREKVHTRPTVLGKTYFETYEDVSSINFHCQKKCSYWKRMGFLSDPQLARW